MDINRILCVCTGNICRSPLAERLLAAALPDATVASAGIGALEGSPMDPIAAGIAKREGLAGDDHVGRQLTQDMVQGFDVILVMEAGQKDWIESEFPQSRGRVFLISRWQGSDDIQDPYRLSSEVFETVYKQLVSCTEDWRARLAP